MECKYHKICELYVSENKSCNPDEGEKPYCGEFRKYEKLEASFIGRFLIKRLRKNLESKI